MSATRSQATQAVAIPRSPGIEFRSEAWRAYFEANASDRAEIGWETGIQVEPALREPLIRSLQRFQVGESGDGKHLRRSAAQTGDADYQQAIAPFIAEEQEHSRLLAHAIDGMDGRLLTYHWSDIAFVAIRRLMGLKLELMVLLVAEMIARCHYRTLHDGTRDSVLRSAVAQIMRDEVGHVRFHCDYLHHAFRDYSGPARFAIRASWRLIYRVTCLVVIYDHRNVIAACGVSRRAFWRDCGAILDDAVTRIFGTFED